MIIFSSFLSFSLSYNDSQIDEAYQEDFADMGMKLILA